MEPERRTRERAGFSANNLEASLLSPYLSGLLEADEQVMRNSTSAKGLKYLLFIYFCFLHALNYTWRAL